MVGGEWQLFSLIAGQKLYLQEKIQFEQCFPKEIIQEIISVTHAYPNPAKS